VIFSSTEHGCEFERRVSDGEQFGQPSGQSIWVHFFFVPSFWACKKKVLAGKGETVLKRIKDA